MKYLVLESSPPAFVEIDMQLLTDATSITRLRKLLTATSARSTDPRTMMWFGASLAFAAVYAVPALRQAFSGPYVVQDDFRQHVFWMQRFLDPELFPHDLIADYCRSIEPAGYVALYREMAKLSIDPILLSKLLPMLLGLITAAYSFGVCMALLPVPTAAFIATVLLTQNLWMRHDLVSATPRAFVYPLFLGFLYYLLRRALFPCLGALALQGLFYPQNVFISVGILLLGLLQWEDGQLRLSRDRGDYVFCATGIGVALLVMLPYALKAPELGPVFTGPKAKAALRILSKTHHSFLIPDKSESFRFFPALRSFLHAMYLKPRLLWLGVFLPVLLRYPSAFPLGERATSRVNILVQIALASFGMFLAAHALLLRLYIPNRYIHHTMPMVMALASGITLTVALDAVFRWADDGARPRRYVRQLLAVGIATVLAVVLNSYAGLSGTRFGYITGEVPALYEFFSRQPKDTLIASVSKEVNNLPTFSKRSILVGAEYARPFHAGYSRQIRKRATDLIRAQYSQDLAEARHLIRTYGVNFLLLEEGAFTPQYMTNNALLGLFPRAAREALISLEQGTPALGRVADRCSVLRIKNLIVLQAECIEKIPEG